jgi:hypothetical protein
MDVAVFVDVLVNLAGEGAGRQGRGSDNEYEKFTIHG